MRRFFLGLCSISLITSQSMAGTIDFPTLPSNWSWVASVSGGPVWEKAGKTQTFYLTEDIEKTYYAQKPTHATFDGEIFLGLQTGVFNNILGQLGLAAAATTNVHLSGDIWDDAAPEFNNYTYEYKIQHTHIALKGALVYETNCWILPWIAGSVGVGFNTSHAYNSSPTIQEALPTPNFASHTETAFSYTLGGGVQAVLNPNWQVGIGYEFVSWGKSRLGRADGQTLNSGLELNHLYTNGFLVNITYLS